MSESSTKFEYLQGSTIIPNVLPKVTPMSLGQLLTNLRMESNRDEDFRQVCILWPDNSRSPVSLIHLPGDQVNLNGSARIGVAHIDFLLMISNHEQDMYNTGEGMHFSIPVLTQNMARSIRNICPIMIADGSRLRPSLHTAVNVSHELTKSNRDLLIIHASKQEFSISLETKFGSDFWTINNFSR